MKMFQKPVSILLTLIMVLGLFSVVPFTAGAATQSGTTGDCTWTLDEETGVLTISGNGDMADYTSSNRAPWGTGIKGVVLENGVTSIGNYAFSNCGELKSISLPDSLISIGDFAFSKVGFESITIPESVEVVGNHVFFYAETRRITFLGAPKLGDGALFERWVDSVLIFKKSMQFDYLDTSTLLDDDTLLIEYDFVIVPDGCTYLKNGEVIPLTPENAHEVFYHAIVSFPEPEDENISWSFDEETGVLTISGTGDMMDYHDSGAIPISETKMTNVTSAPWGAFCKDIQSVVIEEGVTSVGNYAFYNIGTEESGSMMSKVQLPSTIQRIGKGAFYSCEQLTEINLPENLKSIGDYAFYYCDELIQVYLPEGLESIGSHAFGSCALEAVTFPPHLRTIGEFSFAYCALREVTIPESVEQVGNGAFQSNKNLEQVTVSGTPYFNGSTTFVRNASNLAIIFEKANQFRDDEFQLFNRENTVYVPYGSTYNKNGQVVPLTAENAGNVFVGARVLFMPAVGGHSISLNGDIGLNFYLNVSESINLHFAWYNKTYDHTVTAEDYDAASGYYKVTVNVAAAEMTYPITASFTINDVQYDAFDVFSVRDYADIILDRESDFSKGYIASYGAEKYGLLVDLIKKTLDYGAKAQTRFGVTDVPLANEGVDYTMQPVTAYHIDAQKSDMTADLHKYGIDYIGTSIIYLSQTTLRHYYVISDAKLFAKVKDSANFDFVDKGQRICFELKDIPAAQLDVAKAFTLGDSVYRYSVLDYCRLVLADESKSQADKELAMATYWYNDAAKAYFYSSDEYEDDMM